MRKALKRSCVILLILTLMLPCLTACSSHTYKINVVSGKDLVTSCPKKAKAGETVTIETVFVTDADLYLSVDGQKLKHLKDGSYEFTMPDHDVSIDVWIDTSNYPGA